MLGKIKTLGYILLLTVSSVFFFSVADASVIAQESNDATQTTDASFTSYNLAIGNGYTGFVSGVLLEASRSFNNVAGGAYLYSCTTYANSLINSGCTLRASKLDFYTIGASKTSFFVDLSASAYSLDPSLYYLIVPAAGATFSLYGNSASSTSVTSCSLQNGSLNVRCPYFQLQTVDSVPLQTQVLVVNTPTSLQVTSSENVPVQFTYLYNSSTVTYTKVGLEVFDHLTPQLVLNLGEQGIDTTSGVRTYNSILGLTANHFYRLRPYISNGFGTTKIYGPYVDFSTVSDQSFSSNYYATSSSLLSNVSTSSLASIGAQCGDFTLNPIADLGNAICRAFVVLFVPSSSATDDWANVINRFTHVQPFSWFFDFVDTWTTDASVVDASSSPEYAISVSGLTCSGAWTGDLSNITCDPKLKDWMPAKITLFSTTTMSYWIGSSSVDLLRSAFEIAMSFAAGMYFFFRIRGFWDSQATAAV